MKGKRLTLTVIPETGGRAYTIGLPHSALLVLVLVSAVSLLAFAVLVKMGVEKAMNASAVRMQSEENRIIMERIEDFNSEIASISAKVETLKTLGKHVRELSNIKHIPDDALTDQVDGGGGWRGESEDVVSERLDMLVRETSSARGSFEELLSSLSGQERLLRHTPSIRPAAGWLISGYGYTKNPFTGRTEMHKGVDIAAVEGTPICATADGVVSFVGNKPGYGLTVIIDHGANISTWYGHCSIAKVNPGQGVKRGMVIASIGKTGQAIGPHVQYEVRVSGEPVDPEDFFLDSPDQDI
jgi:murein DD-endopeptidase MepM/ murein hydrolase activator NlpD